MLAILAALVFFLELILDLFDVRTGDAFTWQTLLFVGLLLLSLHLAGVGSGVDWRFGRRPAA